jgi:hypothetical protein
VKQTAEHVWDWLRRVLSVGQSIVIVGALVGGAIFVRQLGSQDEDLYPALLKGLGAKIGKSSRGRAARHAAGN